MLANASEVTLTATISGAVQGVGFRYFILQRAVALGLRGWARNRADGAVECLAQGPRGALERLLEDLRRGPPSARVDDVRADWSPGAAYPARFDLLPSA